MELSDSEMAELGDIYDTTDWNATLKLEELKSKLRDGRLHQPNHADADVLLRAWDDPTVRELVPIISANTVPRQARPITPYIPHRTLTLWLKPHSSLSLSQNPRPSPIQEALAIYRGTARPTSNYVKRIGWYVLSGARTY